VVHSLWSKVLAIVLVALALVVALDRISALVAEREGRLREAEASVAASLATHQELTGPVLQRHCEEIGASRSVTARSADESTSDASSIWSPRRRRSISTAWPPSRGAGVACTRSTAMC
jgi:inner membrane protein involved in colicin E2 resistance